MKKAVLVLVGALMVVSCGENPIMGPEYNKVVREGKLTTLTIQAKNGVDEVQDLSFNIDSTTNALLHDAVIVDMAKKAARYATWGVNFPRTYKFKQGTTSHLFYPTENGINVSVSGIAANAYGVEDNIITVIKFNLDGTQKLDEGGFPDILSF